MGSFRPQEAPFDFRYETTLVEALVPAFAAAAHRAFARGLLHGYRAKEEALHTVRGRIRVNEQIRRRFDGFLPIEVRYPMFNTLRGEMSYFAHFLKFFCS